MTDNEILETLKNGTHHTMRLIDITVAVHQNLLDTMEGLNAMEDKQLAAAYLEYARKTYPDDNEMAAKVANALMGLNNDLEEWEISSTKLAAEMFCIFANRVIKAEVNKLLDKQNVGIVDDLTVSLAKNDAISHHRNYVLFDANLVTDGVSQVMQVKVDKNLLKYPQRHKVGVDLVVSEVIGFITRPGMRSVKFKDRVKGND